MKCSDIAVKCLHANGVKHIFGYSGNAVLSLIESLSCDKRIKLITGTHEQFCGFAADGYARASGRCGVVFATSGPGATNLVTPIADAYMDSVPMVAITGNVSLDLLGRDSFQETDIAGVTMPITKHNFIVKSPDKLAETINAAFRIATTGRKGPVLVDIPRDIFDMNVKYTPVKPSPVRFAEIDEDEIATAAELINESRRVFICAGGGVISSGASDSLRRFADRIGCYVGSTYMGKGAFDETDDKFAGFVGMDITEQTSNVLKDSDLFIGVGMRFSERAVSNILRIAPDIKFLHIDIDSAEIGKNMPVIEGVVGDARRILDILYGRVCERKNTCTRVRNEHNNTYDLIKKYFPTAVYTTEVGLHQVAANHYLKVSEPRSFITAGGLGPMGFGLPAAIGAAFACPDKRIVNIAGDGSFNMNLASLATAVQYNLPITQIVINNHSLGMIAKLQSDSGRHGYGREMPDIDYISFAHSVGCRAVSARNDAEFAAALRLARSRRTPCLIEYVTED